MKDESHLASQLRYLQVGGLSTLDQKWTLRAQPSVAHSHLSSAHWIDASQPYRIELTPLLHTSWRLSGLWLMALRSETSSPTIPSILFHSSLHDDGFRMTIHTIHTIHCVLFMAKAKELVALIALYVGTCGVEILYADKAVRTVVPLGTKEIR